MAKRTTPLDHTSTGGPSYALLATISGAAYDGDPQCTLSFFAVAGENRAQTEIDELDVLPRVQEHVLQLDVPVHHPVAVAVVQPAAHLVEKTRRLWFGELFTPPDVIEQRTAVGVLHDDVDNLGRIHDVEQPDDVLVRQSPEHSDLASHPSPVVFLREFRLVHELHRRLRPRHLVHPEPNLTEPALADHLAEDVPRKLRALVDGPNVHHGPGDGGARPALARFSFDRRPGRIRFRRSRRNPRLDTRGDGVVHEPLNRGLGGLGGLGRRGGRRRGDGPGRGDDVRERRPGREPRRLLVRHPRLNSVRRLVRRGRDRQLLQRGHRVGSIGRRRPRERRNVTDLTDTTDTDTDTTRRRRF
mmetsp:Transcript_178/g.669  ORF Transcript_178/g.669 Transcript_178/m.669 type:complete len:357 (-) Transcript_178:1101-2171(-)